MKIYASRNLTSHVILDKYLGKDVWILARIDRAGKNWIKVNSYKDGVYIFNSIPWGFVKDCNFTGGVDGKQYYTTHTIAKFSWQIIFILPLEIITGDELFGDA